MVFKDELNELTQAVKVDKNEKRSSDLMALQNQSRRLKWEVTRLDNQADGVLEPNWKK